jgi:heme/copper-type cytochrome/quinol oxidase subunit 3
MTSFVGFHHLHVMVLGQVLVHKHRVAGRYRGGKRVDNQQNTQEINFTAAYW